MSCGTCSVENAFKLAFMSYKVRMCIMIYFEDGCSNWKSTLFDHCNMYPEKTAEVSRGCYFSPRKMMCE